MLRTTVILSVCLVAGCATTGGDMRTDLAAMKANVDQIRVALATVESVVDAAVDANETGDIGNSVQAIKIGDIEGSGEVWIAILAAAVAYPLLIRPLRKWLSERNTPSAFVGPATVLETATKQ